MIIESLLDNDLYTFTMWQAFYHQFPSLRVNYSFKCRTPNANLANLRNQIEKEIDHFCTLRFKADELRYLRDLRFMKEDFVDFLRLFQANKCYVHITTDGEDLFIEIEGPVVQTIIFEMPILSIISEIYGQQYWDLTNEGVENLKDKVEWLRIKNPSSEGFKFADYGTRRRFSKEWHVKVVKYLHVNFPNCFVGTSNVWIAKMLGITPLGTMAHQWIMAGQGLPNISLRYSQQYMLQAWANEYRGDLGTAISDTLGIDAFLNDFDLYFAKLFDGIRLDSGDPKVSGDKVIEQYKKMKIDPMTKTIIPSDSLDFEKAWDLFAYFKGRIGIAFGIGTHLTNDVGLPNLNIVIKPTSFNGRPVAKLSDSPGKMMCKDLAYVEYLKKVFNI